jgi:hypothetical protein
MRRRAALLILTALIIGAAGLWAVRTATARPSVVLETTTVDFGPVAAPATKTVVVRNVGRAPLRVLGISASCGCTTATIERTVMEPGSTARLTITFDPVAHGPTPGPARHTVYLRTNDPRVPEAEVGVRAVVVKKAAQ